MMTRDWPTVVASLAAALVITLAPLPAEVAVYMPQWMLLVVLYWCIMAPVRMGLWMAWLTGLLLDIGSHSLLGSNALLFTLAAAMTLSLQRLLKTMGVMQQALYVAGLSVVYLLIELWIRGGIEAPIESWQYLMRALSNLAAWPLLFVVIGWMHRRLG